MKQETKKKKKIVKRRAITTITILFKDKTNNIHINCNSNKEAYNEICKQVTNMTTFSSYIYKLKIE